MIDWFIPDGYVALTAAILRTAQRSMPAIWDTASEGERSLWSQLPFKSAYDVRGDVCEKYVTADQGSSHQRCLAYDFAMHHVQRALHAGKLTGFFIDPMTGVVHAVEPASAWATESGQIAVLDGYGSFQNGSFQPPERPSPLFLNVEDIDHLVVYVREEIASTSDDPIAGPGPRADLATVSDGDRRTWPKATDAEIEAAFLAYMDDEMSMTNIPEEQAAIERRIGKRLDRDYFREVRRRLSTVPLKQGPRAGVVKYAKPAPR